MNLFSWFRSRDKPKNLFTGDGSFTFGMTSSGNRVNSHTAMQMSAVYACVRIQSEALEKITNHPKYLNFYE